MDKTVFRLTKSELEIMEVLWKEEKPLSRSFILSHAPHRTWKDSSIHILLNSMLDKGAIQIEGFEQTGGRIARTFVPTLTANEYYAMIIKTSDAYHEENLPELLSALLEDVNDKAILKQMTKIIREKEKQLDA